MTKMRWMRPTALACSGILLLAGCSWTKRWSAAEFDNAREVLQSGDTVTVTTVQGTKLTGKMVNDFENSFLLEIGPSRIVRLQSHQLAVVEHQEDTGAWWLAAILGTAGAAWVGWLFLSILKTLSSQGVERPPWER